MMAWPETTWSAEGRLGGRTAAPLTEVGRQMAGGWAGELTERGVGTLFVGEDQASVETAEAIGAVCRVKRKVAQELAEVDLGLWDGLSTAELQRRYPKIYKLWRQDLKSVCPPEGEAILEARSRLREALERILKRLGDKAVGVIVGPLAFALLRSVIERTEDAELLMEAMSSPVVYDAVSSNGAMVLARADGGLDDVPES